MSLSPRRGLARRPAEFDLRRADGALLLRLAGDWCLQGGALSADPVQRELSSASPPDGVRFDAGGLGSWDSSVLTFLLGVEQAARDRGVSVDRAGLPEGIRRLLTLAEAVPEKEDALREERTAPIVERIGRDAIAVGTSLSDTVEFLGEALIAFGRFFRGKARFRRTDLVLLIQQAGAEALPIVVIVSFLLGLILAFVGAVQLGQFGATIYVADLVGVAMVRDMGALITAIVMAGRTGAAYAAQLGSMRVTQEIDALATMGISPIEYLVLPRLIALVAMMPLLCLFSDFVGILGGASIGVGLLGLSPVAYLQQTTSAVSVNDLVGGVFKATVYGALVALAGCLRGMQSGRSSSAVGDAATSAVVSGIVAIIAACGLFAYLFFLLGI